MLERPLNDLTDDLQQGHPHDLLAKLYREIGISAVAAALEVTKSVPAPEKQQRPPVAQPLPPKRTLQPNLSANKQHKNQL